MAEVTRRTRATPREVFAVLADGWVYSTWVVGASRIRDVDDGWPVTGSRIHHSFGAWPVMLDDTTSVLECVPERLLRLEARGWPFGQATIELTLEPDDEGCLIRMVEDASQGPGRLVPELARRAVLVPRNHESLKRLCYLAEGRAQAAERRAR